MTGPIHFLSSSMTLWMLDAHAVRSTANRDLSSCNWIGRVSLVRGTGSPRPGFGREGGGGPVVEEPEFGVNAELSSSAERLSTTIRSSAIRAPRLTYSVTWRGGRSSDSSSPSSPSSTSSSSSDSSIRFGILGR
ncbi:hypothetical protein FS842_003916 [Serendipita sp. 407]|nr:hypothetical protein FS842_003916 [Serendipita sp. 407]